ncbi:MAG: hydrogen peroxide-inducible genes activator, partial [Roseovarius sp.]
IHLRRFDPPEPARQIVLVRRQSTHDEVWFEKLAEVLETVGDALIALARTDVPNAATVTRPAPQATQADIYRDTH